MGIFDELAKKDHEQVIFCHDKDSGLRAIIAIHNTTLGPALGGCRMWPYDSEEAALKDVLRLSRGMTYKSAAAGLNLGGGKAVIIGDAKKMKTEHLFRAFGRFVQSLGGRYITAEDVGTSVGDMEWVRMETNFVTGIPEAIGGSGDPSAATALGVFQGIRAALNRTYGSDTFESRTIAVQGVGAVGHKLLKHLVAASAKVVACDAYPEAVKRAKAEYPMVEFVAAESIYDVPCDVFAPCALGGAIDDQTIPRLRCKIVAGSANNMLADEDKHSAALAARDILYVPDFVINAGGIINVANELIGYDRGLALQQVAGIYAILTNIFQIAAEEKITTLKAANSLAERRIEQVGHIKNTFVGVPLRA
jgi:leucine dehydrogenase